jgi:hypothetical protein
MTTTHPTPPPTDDDLRALFAPLAADEPTDAERAALRRRAGAAASATPPRPAWRPVLAVAATTVAVGAGLALLPGDDRTAGAPAGAAALLRATAAVAADQPVPAPADAPLRYVRLRETITYTATDGGRAAQDHHEQVLESWVGARWQGRTHADALDKARDGAYAYGDGPLADLDPAELPQGRDAIAATLRDGIAANRWALRPADRGVPAKAGLSSDSLVTYSIINLLVAARLTPDQRAALLDVLSDDPAAQDLGEVKDADGRTGRGVALSYSGDRQLAGVGSFRVIFDPDTAEILQWSLAPAVGDAGRGMERAETILQAGFAPAVGQRP